MAKPIKDPQTAIKRMRAALTEALTHPDGPDALFDHRWPSAVERLEQGGYITWTGGAWTITDRGRAWAE